MNGPAEVGPRVGRRAFLGRSIASLGAAPMAALAAACASLVTRTVTPIDGTLRLALVHYPELSEPQGSLKVLPAGMADPVYVLALGERRFVALSPICTHLGCTVEIQESLLVCPCHGSTYDRQGSVLKGPAERALARYRAELSPDGVVIIDLNRPS